MLRPSSLVEKRRPPGNNSAQSSVDLGAAEANVTKTNEEKILTKQAVRHRVAPEAEAWFLDNAAMQEAAVCAVPRTIMRQSLEVPPAALSRAAAIVRGFQARIALSAVIVCILQEELVKMGYESTSLA